MNLNLVWSAPTPNPSCGFKAQYRRKGDPAYTELDISGSTVSGSTIAVVAPANYEGMIISNCCETVSAGQPFGVNAYVPLYAVASYSSGLQKIIITLTSAYSIGYDVLIQGSVTINGIPTAFSGTYSAGSTSSIIEVQSGSPSNVLTNTVLTVVAPVFNNGGQLQQLDSINTPSYFKLYWSGNISGATWTGAPTQLPSFTLDAFNVTETSSPSGEILAGNLLMSYVLGEVFDNTSGFTSVSIEVFDPVGTVLIGSTIVNVTPLGLRNISISLAKSTSLLTTATAFTMKVLWPNDTVIDTKTFYLPT